MLDRVGYRGRLEITGELERALDGADFVLIQIRVGGQEARLRDETIPLPCGCIGQETTGAGGLAKALRTVPVVLEIADEVRRRAAPGAWIVDFTNPVGIVTRALLDARPPRGRPLQRVDHLPAPRGAAARRRAGAHRGRPGRAQPPHVGARGAGRRRGRARHADGRPRRRARRGRRPAAAAARGARRRALLLPALLLRARPRAGRAARGRAARGRGRRDRARAAGDVPRPRR